MKLGHASLTTLFLLHFEGLFFDTNNFRFEDWQNIEEFSLACLLDTKNVQLVKENLSDLIFYPRKNNFNSFTVSG